MLPSLRIRLSRRFNGRLHVPSASLGPLLTTHVPSMQSSPVLQVPQKLAKLGSTHDPESTGQMGHPPLPHFWPLLHYENRYEKETDVHMT